MKPRFEELFIDMTLRIDPVFNQGVGMPDQLVVRRGVSHARGYASFDEMVEHMTWELRAGLGALKHRLQMGGYVEMDSPTKMDVFREAYLRMVADELRAAGYDVTKKEQTSGASK